MFKAKKWMVLGLFGLVAAAGATVLTVPTWSTSASGQSSRRGSSGFGAGSAQQAATQEERPGRYIIVYREAALATYDGRIASLPAPPSLATSTSRRRARTASTSRAPGARVREHLQRRQKLENTIAGALGHRLAVHHRMQHAMNAEVVELTASEAARVGKLPDVASSRHTANTASTPNGPGA